MGKKRGFNYGLEFYHQNIFSLDNPAEFKKRVEEAEMIEKYFNGILPNVEYIRPYILLSYKMNKEIFDKDRINYIKGLVYALDYVDFDDLCQIPEEYEYLDEEFKNENSSEKTSVWKFTGYSSETNNKEYLSFGCGEEDIDYDLLEKISKENSISMTQKAFEEILEIVKDSGVNEDNDTTILIEEYDVEEEIQQTKRELEEQYEGASVDLDISVEDKIKIFKKYADNYIESCVNYQLDNNKLTINDIPMFVLAIKDWFTFIFDAMDDLINIRINSVKYKEKNIVNFL